METLLLNEVEAQRAQANLVSALAEIDRLKEIIKKYERFYGLCIDCQGPFAISELYTGPRCISCHHDRQDERADNWMEEIEELEDDPDIDYEEDQIDEEEPVTIEDHA